MTGKQWQRYFDFFLARLNNQKLPQELFAESWIATISPLYWRVPIFLWSTCVTVWSMVSFWGPWPKFFLYLTHWGLLLIVLESFFGIIATLKRKPNISDVVVNSPWYMRTYWTLYNITIPIAFLVTIFYWCVLRSGIFGNGQMKYAPAPALDAMVHCANSGAAAVELALSAHRPRLGDLMQPLYFGLVYLIFTFSYYVAGGLDPWGNEFIYPMVRWSQPLSTVAVAAATGALLAGLHVAAVGFTVLRNKLLESDQPPCNEYA